MSKRGEGTILPPSVLARAKMKIAFGQAPLLPCSRSLRVFLEPNWRASRVLGAGALRAMGEAVARAAKAERVRSFMVGGQVLSE